MIIMLEGMKKKEEEREWTWSFVFLVGETIVEIIVKIIFSFDHECYWILN